MLPFFPIYSSDMSEGIPEIDDLQEDLAYPSDIVVLHEDSPERNARVERRVAEARKFFDKSGALFELTNMAKILNHLHPMVEIDVISDGTREINTAVLRLSPEVVKEGQPGLITQEEEGNEVITWDQPTLWRSRGIMVRNVAGSKEIEIYYLKGRAASPDGSSVESEDGLSDEFAQAYMQGISHDPINGREYEKRVKKLEDKGSMMKNWGPSGVGVEWKPLHPGRHFDEDSLDMSARGRPITLAGELTRAFRKSSPYHDARKGDDVQGLSGSSLPQNIVKGYQMIPFK